QSSNDAPCIAGGSRTGCRIENKYPNSMLVHLEKEVVYPGRAPLQSRHAVSGRPTRFQPFHAVFLVNPSIPKPNPPFPHPYQMRVRKCFCEADARTPLISR